MSLACWRRAGCALPLMTLGSGCAPQIGDPGLAMLTVSAAQTGAAIDLDYAGRQPLTIRLDSHRSTGFAWRLTDLTGGVLETVGPAPTYTASAQGGGLLGAAGTESWTFRPVRTGDALIRFEYRRPWENGREALRSAVYHVRVR